MEAEYVAMASAVKELLWTQSILDFLGISILTPVKVFEDNLAARLVANEMISTPKSRHIEVRFHLLRYHVKYNNITIEYCRSHDMIADVLTKPLSRHTLERFADKLGLVSKRGSVEGYC